MNNVSILGNLELELNKSKMRTSKGTRECVAAKRCGSNVKLISKVSKLDKVSEEKAYLENEGID